MPYILDNLPVDRGQLRRKLNDLRHVGLNDRVYLAMRSIPRMTDREKSGVNASYPDFSILGYTRNRLTSNLKGFART
jgi:hypothetical protein